MDEHSDKDSTSTKIWPKNGEIAYCFHQRWGILPVINMFGDVPSHLCFSRTRGWTSRMFRRRIYLCMLYRLYSRWLNISCIYMCVWVWKAWVLAIYDRAERNVYYGSGVSHQMMRMTKVAPCFQVATTEWFCQRSRTEMLFPLINESGSFNIKLFALPVLTPPYCLSATNEWTSFPRQGITSLVLAVLMGESMQGANGRGICLDD